MTSGKTPGTPRSRALSKERGQWGTEWTVEPAIQGNGGLTNAVRASSDAGSISDVFWVGTVGFPTDSLNDNMKDEIHERLETEYDALTVYVSDSDLDGHYTHYCKTMLWPVFHYQIPDHPRSKAYEDHSYRFYKNVNQAFADKIIKSYKRGDIILINDYHLLLVPGMVRKKLPDAQIGFFLHTAFPSSEVFRCLAVRKELLEGMLGANLVAFQSPEYSEHFLTTCSRLMVVEATPDGVQLEDRFVNVSALPIGIDPKGLMQTRADAEVQEWIDVMQQRYKGKKLIVARDQLDNIRGVRQKLLAFELFLNKNPDWRDQVAHQFLYINRFVLTLPRSFSFKSRHLLLKTLSLLRQSPTSLHALTACTPRLRISLWFSFVRTLPSRSILHSSPWPTHSWSPACVTG